MATWSWTLDDNASDLAFPGDNFDKRLLRFAEGSGEIQVSVGFDSTEGDFFWSEPGEPSREDWPAGPWRAGVDIITANAKITLAVGLARVSSAGAFKGLYAALSQPMVCSAGLKIFSGTTIQQEAAASDRLRLLFQWVRDASLGSLLVGFGFGDPARDFVEVPILMANPSIVWNANVLNFPGPLTGIADPRKARRFLEMSDGKVHATQVRTSFDEVRIALANFEDAAFEADLHAWWAWAKQGNQYAFAVDNDDTIDTTLDGAAAAGQKVIPLTSTTGIVAGKKYRLIESAGHNDEIVQVDTIQAGVSVTALNNLRFGYASADVFRSRGYFPKVVALESDRPWQENPGLTWTLEHAFREDAA